MADVKKTGKNQVLFIVTSHDKLLNGQPTGFDAREAGIAYLTVSPHHEVIFASPKGGEAPIDPNSVKAFRENYEESSKFLDDPECKRKIKETLKLTEVWEKEFLGVFYVGGHGPVFDLAEDPRNIQIAGDFVKSFKPIAAICHGPGALINVMSPHFEDRYFVHGKLVTSWSNEEEEKAGFKDAVPWLVETKLRERGADYKGHAPGSPHVEADEILLTGANPASAKPLAEKFLEALSKSRT